MKKGLKTLGIGIILLGIAFIVNYSLVSITGNVVSENIRATGSILGIIFMVIGIALFLAEEGGLEKISKKQKKAITKLENWLKTRNVGTARDLIQQIKRAGYDTKEAAGHTELLYEGKKITMENRQGQQVPVTIPRHQGDIATGTYKSILTGVVRDVYKRYNY